MTDPTPSQRDATPASARPDASSDPALGAELAVAGVKEDIATVKGQRA